MAQVPLTVSSRKRKSKAGPHQACWVSMRKLCQRKLCWLIDDHLSPIIWVLRAHRSTITGSVRASSNVADKLMVCLICFITYFLLAATYAAPSIYNFAAQSTNCHTKCIGMVTGCICETLRIDGGPIHLQTKQSYFEICYWAVFPACLLTRQSLRQ